MGCGQQAGDGGVQTPKELCFGHKGYQLMQLLVPRAGNNEYILEMLFFSWQLASSEQIQRAFPTMIYKGG